MAEVVKVCKKHGELTLEKCLPVKDKRWGDPDRITYKCWHCNYENQLKYRSKPGMKEYFKKKNKEYAINHREKHLASRKRWREKNLDRRNFLERRWRAANLEKCREIGRKQQKKWIDSLHDIYVKNIIFRSLGIKASEITQEMIELKRVVIMLRREIRKRQDERKRD